MILFAFFYLFSLRKSLVMKIKAKNLIIDKANINFLLIQKQVIPRSYTEYP